MNTSMNMNPNKRTGRCGGVVIRVATLALGVCAAAMLWLPLPAAGDIGFGDVTPSDYAQRMKITFAEYDDGGGSMDTLTNFPVLVVLYNSVDGSDFTYTDFDASHNGYDLTFIDDDGTTIIPHEVEGTWTDGGTNYVWVRVPELVDNTSYIYAYWGKSGAAQPAYTTNGAVWANGFAGVWHMQQINPANDSTANDNDLVNTLVTATNSPVGAAAHFNGSAKFEKATSASLTLASNITMSAWVKYTAPSEAYNAVIEKQSSVYVYSLFVKQADSTLAAFWYDNGGDKYVNGGGTALSIGVWTHVTATWDSSTIKTFLNGSANQSKIAAAASWTAPDGVFSLGHSKYGGRWFKGDLDEVRISSLPRSADWVWAEWKNMASPMVFNAYGNMMGGVVPVLDAPTATDITTTTATLGANVTSDGGSAVIQRGTLWGPATDPTGNSQAADLGTGTGVFTHERTSLDAGTKIYYRGYATNAVDTAYSPSGSFYTEPANQAPSVSISDLGNTSMKISWTTGNGAGRIVLVKANSVVDTPPSDGIDSGYNTATTVFGSCPEIGTGNRVVYKGNTAPNEVTVTSLSPNTTYHVAVYEYAGSGEDAGVNKGINYRTDTVPTASDTTLSGTVAPTLSSPTVTAIGATTATLGATV